MTPASARAIAAGRRALPWAVGVAAVILRERSLELVAPNRCPSLLEFISIAAVTLDSTLTVGILLSAMHAAAIIVALALFVDLARRFAGGSAAATAAALAIGLGPLLPRTLAPPWEAASFATCAAAALLLRRSRSAGLKPCAPAVVPILALAFGGFAILAISSLALARADVFGGPSSWRALAACVAPRAPGSIFSRLIGHLDTIGQLTGPFVLALAVLGVYAWSRRVDRRRTATAILVATTGLLLPVAIDLDPRITLTPWVIGLWLFAVAGLTEILAAVGRGPVRRFAAVLLLVLVPALQIARRDREERDDQLQPMGHEDVTLDRIRVLLNVVPTRAVFAEEDASIDLLLRASIFGGRRRDKPFTVVPRQEETLSAAHRARSVYAFPRGQHELGDRGFVIEAVTAPTRRPDPGERIDGLAVVIGRRYCEAIGSVWSDLGAIAAGGRIALAADGEPGRGPVVMYLGGLDAATPRPDGWPLRVTSGFHVAIFDQPAAAPSAQLLAMAQMDGVPADQPVLLAPVVVRLALNRTPRAPLTLPVVLGGPFPVAIAKLERDAVAGARVQLCDAPAIEIAAFNRRDSAQPSQ